MMPSVEIEIGERVFEVACQEGEEHYLRTAAQMLDAEADRLTRQIGRLPEARMLLMAGLMLADRTAGVEDQLREAQERLAAQEARIAELEARPAAAPPQATAALTALAERAEGLAAEAEARTAEAATARGDRSAG